MLQFVIGSEGHGKLDYVLRTNGLDLADVSYCQNEALADVFDKKIVYGLHFLVERLWNSQVEPIDFVLSRIKNKDLIIICNEYAKGQEWEPLLVFNQLCCALAELATVMIRVTYGIPAVLKNRFTISLIRHGQTEGNEKKQYIGFTDQLLTEAGKETLRKYQAMGLYPDCERLFVSPLKRCIQTKELVYGDKPYEVLEGLKENNFGDYEGLTFEEILAREANKDWGMSLENMIFPNGESRADFSRRVMQTFESIIAVLEKENQHDKVCVICHGGTIWCILENVLMQRFGDYVWGVLKNGCGVEIAYDAVIKKAIITRKIEPETVEAI